MRLPRKLILLLTLWAYAAQAIAGVAGAGCLHEGETVVMAAAPAMHAAMTPAHLHSAHMSKMDHSQMDHAQHGAPASESAEQPATVAADCCAHCADSNCSCSSHGCASAQSGVLPAATPITANQVAAVPAAPALDSRLRQAHSLGLIRPPAVS